MARLAERLGCATMSLYRHVASKDDLLVFMMDAAPGAPPVIDVAVHGWRGGLERWARELRAFYYRHPWSLQITHNRPPLEPGQLAWLDCCLRTMAGTRLSPHEKLAVCFLLLQYIRGEAQLNLSMSPTKEHPDWNGREMQAWYGRTLARLIDAERFPALAELSASGAFEPGDDEAGQSAEFDFGLSRILDGVEMVVRR
ncbi:hypothetical protein BON30_17945 [Cystobacter ferrugineus]|uniref:Tetracycline repressor TetR C-terminal domain-containing protein n=2 Tax=Cystobacter ferrugineus TaxID=83449 RepID=A0A1L9BC14_9BACT|nr:hypothetical protein BON30_17945 [Cystobacter ferrugineus]